MNDTRGCYTVKSGYMLIIGEFDGNARKFNKLVSLWKIKAPPKWKTFLWRALNNKKSGCGSFMPNVWVLISLILNIFYPLFYLFL